MAMVTVADARPAISIATAAPTYSWLKTAGVTHLFHNDLAKPGVRIRLAGPEGNYNGIGAQVSLGFGTERGPIKEVRSGGGILEPGQPYAGLWRRKSKADRGVGTMARRERNEHPDRSGYPRNRDQYSWYTKAEIAGDR